MDVLDSYKKRWDIKETVVSIVRQRISVLLLIILLRGGGGGSDHR